MGAAHDISMHGVDQLVATTHDMHGLEPSSVNCHTHTLCQPSLINTINTYNTLMTEHLQ